MILRLTPTVFGNGLTIMLALTVFTVCSCTRQTPIQKGTAQAHKTKAGTEVPNVAHDSQKTGETEARQAHGGTDEADSRTVKNAVESFSAGLAVNHPLRKSVACWSSADWGRMREELRNPSNTLKDAFFACISEALHSVDPVDALSTIASNLLDVADATHDKAFANAIISQASSVEQSCQNYAGAYDLARSVIDRAAHGEPCDLFVLNFCRNQAVLTSAQQDLYEQAERELHEWQAASPSPSDRERFMMAYSEANMYLCCKPDELLSKARIKRGYDVLKKMSEAPYMSGSQRKRVQNMIGGIEQYYPYLLNR